MNTTTQRDNRPNSSVIRRAETFALTALLVAAFCNPALGQVQPLISVDVENMVNYVSGITSQPKLVPNPNITPAGSADTEGLFFFAISIGDIVSINGQPAKGTVVFRAQFLDLTPLGTGGPIADTARGVMHTMTIEILKQDGSPVGILMLTGLSGAPPVGAPLAMTSFNYAIVGGTGAFLGARGQAGAVTLSAPRTASMAENPANRRINGGGKRRYLLQLIPNSIPQIAAEGNGPAIYHEDFSPVTEDQPAKAGEVLIVKATGVGPTGVPWDSGQPFPLDSPPMVSSPIEVTVNGTPAEVINQVGWPGLVDTYRIDFRVPGGNTAGPASVQLTAAWIAGLPTAIPIQ